MLTLRVFAQNTSWKERRLINGIIIWLPCSSMSGRAFKMNQILYCDWLLEMARWLALSCLLGTTRCQCPLGKIERLSMPLRQTGKMKLLPSVFSCLFSRVTIFVFAVNSRRHFSIFMWVIKDFQETLCAVDCFRFKISM